MIKKGGIRMFNIGIPSLILILVVALLVFGPKKLPELGKAVGNTLKEFKKTTNELTEEFDNLQGEKEEVKN